MKKSTILPTKTASKPAPISHRSAIQHPVHGKKTVRIPKPLLTLNSRQLIEEYIDADDFSVRTKDGEKRSGTENRKSNVPSSKHSGTSPGVSGKKQKVATAAVLGSYAKEGANVMYSFPGLVDRVFEKVSKVYFLNHRLPSRVARAHLDGDVYLHDLGKGMVGYCAGWSLRKLLMEGLNGVPDRLSTTPPKHLDSAIDQMGRFIQIVCNEWSGAQAFSSVDTYLAPFVYYDGLPYTKVKQAVQHLFFMLYTHIRNGGKVPFSNISLDWTVSGDLKEQNVVIGGEIRPEVYGQFQREMDMINRAILEVFIEGDATEQPFSYPIPTYNLTKDFDWNSPNANLLFELTAKYGTPYFQNFINSDLNPTDVRAMCCRLQMNLKDLANKTGGLFGAGESTGSVGVADVNMGRIGYLCKGKSEKELFAMIGKRMDICCDYLEDKRAYVAENLDKGLMPYTRRYLGSFKTFFSTIGLVGVNEMMLNYRGTDLTDIETRDFAASVLQFMRERIQQYQEETGNLYNLEASPAENASYHLARLDRERFPDIVTQGNGDPYYTNSSQLPVDATDDVFEALTLQEPLQRLYTGGTVFHVFLGERIADAAVCRDLVKKVATEYKVPYFSITPTFSICEDHGYLAGEKPTCPTCGKLTNIYSRIVGYYRPIQRWNQGKVAEYGDRREFSVC
ncbi:MAG: ribonucleoside triphosphate reductase [Candidatus Dojkabacteria bacterium]|nr:ribonucleoside triphosphate reductase [Candidatus Dojkabacteria bacterium]